jgi:hypothetical protein
MAILRTKIDMAPNHFTAIFLPFFLLKELFCYFVIVMA